MSANIEVKEEDRRRSSVDSIASLDSDIHSQNAGYSEGLCERDVPLELTSIVNEAVTRAISRIQSRRSSLKNENSKAEPQNPEDLEQQLKKLNSVNDAKYSRFSRREKIVCVSVAAASGFLSPLASLAFLPAIPEIAHRFHTTDEIINISNAVYCVFMSLSPCLFSPCSDIYGRRVMFLLCAFFFSASNILVAVSQNLAMFYIFRITTALFGTSFFSIGGHIVGDCFHPTNRGKAMSAVVSGAQVGTGFGPVLGGVIVTYTSWRVIFWAMTGVGFIVMAVALFFLPETAVQTKHSLVLAEARKDNPNKKFVFVWFNPLKIMSALKYPNLSIDGFVCISVTYNMFLLVTPIRPVLAPRFHLTSPIYSGLFYLAPGMGFLIGSFIGGAWADHTVRRYTKKRGRRVPEDRIRTVLIPLGVMYPAGMLIYGWSVEKEVGGMAVPLVFMFIMGVAQTCAFPAMNAYYVDSMPELGGDAIASGYFSRYLAAAVASGTCSKSIANIGVGWTCTIGAFVLYAGVACAVVLIYWGEKMRINALVRYGLREPNAA